MIRKISVCVLSLCLAFCLIGCGTNDTHTTTQQNGETASKIESQQEEIQGVKGKHHAEITVKDYGVIKVELDGDTAPITVANFIKLANEKFYDGLTFHRIIEDFVIQGGDPLGNGMGGSDEEIKGEFLANGVENNISHKRGVISMARATAYDSASSQFFIVHEDNLETASLDGLYAAFGVVTEGMEVVDKIVDQTPVIDRNGTVLPADQPIIESIVIVD